MVLSVTHQLRSDFFLFNQKTFLIKKSNKMSLITLQKMLEAITRCKKDEFEFKPSMNKTTLRSSIIFVQEEAHLPKRKRWNAAHSPAVTKYLFQLQIHNTVNLMLVASMNCLRCLCVRRKLRQCIRGEARRKLCLRSLTQRKV